MHYFLIINYDCEIPLKIRKSKRSIISSKKTMAIGWFTYREYIVMGF
jgi:hypothetical protein